jgi:hypothetical protein
VVSILRLQSLYVISRAKDVTWENPLAAIWSSVEINTGILCSCLPTLRSCVARVFPKLLDSFRWSPNSSGGDAGRDMKESGGSEGESTQGFVDSQRSEVAGSHKTNKRISAASFKRGLTSWGEATHTSQVHSNTGDGHSSDGIDWGPLGQQVSDGSGGIQVTTVVEQDVEQLAGAGEWESSLMRPIGLDCEHERSFERTEQLPQSSNPD